MKHITWHIKLSFIISPAQCHQPFALSLLVYIHISLIATQSVCFCKCFLLTLLSCLLVCGLSVLAGFYKPWLSPTALYSLYFCLHRLTIFLPSSVLIILLINVEIEIVYQALLLDTIT